MLIEIKNVHKYYERSVALCDISLCLKNEHVYGLVGENGAGKSSLIRLITGSHYPNSGEVKVLNYDMRLESEKALFQIGYCPENNPLYPDMTILEYLTFIGQAKGLRGIKLKRSLEEVLESFNLEKSLHKLTQTLSHGFRQRISLAQAFLGNPKLVVLDEPTNGLDPEQTLLFRRFLKQKSQQMALLFSSHILSEVEHNCDILIIISSGKIKAVGKPQQISFDYGVFNRLEIYVVHPQGIDIRTTLQESLIFDLIEIQNFPEGSKVLIELKPDNTEEDLLEWIRNHHLTLKSMIPQNQRIEHLFHKINRGDKI